MNPESISALRRKLSAEMGHHGGFPVLFEHLDRVAFFVKNRDFRIVYANRNFYERLGFQKENEIVGKEDFEIFPEPLAVKFRKDDETVLEGGCPMPRMVELFLSRQGLPDWFITNKVPVTSPKGDPVGVMGTVQRYDRGRGLDSLEPCVSKAVRRMLDYPGEVGSLRELARELGLSHRHFDRRFKEGTGLTPKQFLGRSRIQSACERLRSTRLPIADIAIDLGFCDQSAMTSQFRRRMGFTPLQYRKRFGGEDR